MTKDEALKLALKELEAWLRFTHGKDEQTKKAINAIKEALTQTDKYSFGIYGAEDLDKAWKSGYDNCKAQRTWVGLTNNDLQPIAEEYRILFGSWVHDFARAIENKLKQKNGYAEENT